MKKNIMIFSSFILALLILLIPNNKVSAEELRTYNIDNQDYIDYFENNSNYFDILKGVVPQLETLSETYDIFISLSIGNTNTATFYFYNNDFDSIYNLIYYSKNNSIGYVVYFDNVTSSVFKYYYVQVDLDTYNTSDLVFNYINNHINTTDILSRYLSSYNRIFSLNMFDSSNTNTFNTLYYSSVDITYNSVGYAGSTNYDEINITYKNNPIDYLTYYDYSENENPTTYGLLDTLKFMMNFNIENLGNTLNVITNNQLLLIPFAVILLIAVIRIFKVVL